MEEPELYQCFTWRNVFVDEAHQIQGTMKRQQRGMHADAREVLLMAKAAELQVAGGRWCLTGTPLRAVEQVACMDRIFTLLGCGFRARNLTNAQFLYILATHCIRYTKEGTFQVRQMQQAVCHVLGVAL